MRIPLSWLKEFIDINIPIDQLANLMTMAGMEVEYIHHIGHPEADLPWDRDKFFLVQLLKVEKHPNADKLVLATVDLGNHEETVVTGAPNLQPFVGHGDLRAQGLKSAFVMEGATVYDGHSSEPGKKMKLKGREIRGIMNRHMLCSELELGLSDDHEGIMLFEHEAAPGTPLVDVLGDVVLEFDLLPNIARTASIVGVAREVAALTGGKLRYPDYSIQAEGPSLRGKLKIETTRPDLNPRFTAILVEGVTLGTSPYWMQHRLRLAGMRPISNIVDISNYVMLEMGQPNHVFDWDVLQQRAQSYSDDGQVHIITRMAEPGEAIETLDGEMRTMPESAILVTDRQSGLSVGGIMGGGETEVSNRSTNLLIEAAAWNPINIRQTATALKINSEAGYRFSRGVHPAQAMLGALRVAHLIHQISGGTIAEDMIDYYPEPPAPVVLDIAPAEVEQVLGISLSQDDVQGYLQRLEFVCEPLDDQRLRVTVPDHRLDIDPDPVIGRADLIEEIARMVGYDTIPVTELADTLPPQRNNVLLAREETLRDILVEAGLYEIVSYRLTTAEAEARLYADDSEPLINRPYVSLINPSSLDRVDMRQRLLSIVLDTVAANSRFNKRIQLFEIGGVFLGQTDGSLPDELPGLVLAMTGPRDEASWLGADLTPVDFYDLKGVIENMLAGLHIPQVKVEAVRYPSYYPGRTAAIYSGNIRLGVFGQLHPKVALAYELSDEEPILAAEFDLNALLNAVEENFSVRPLGRFPAVQQDIALVVDEGLPAAQVEAAIREAGGPLLVDVQLFDVYRGEQIGTGKKSMAYSLSFQAPDKTLNDRVVAKQQQRILKQLAKSIGASLRG